jgi:hypothetical protein
VAKMWPAGSGYYRRSIISQPSVLGLIRPPPEVGGVAELVVGARHVGAVAAAGSPFINLSCVIIAVWR